MNNLIISFKSFMKLASKCSTRFLLRRQHHYLVRHVSSLSRYRVEPHRIGVLPLRKCGKEENSIRTYTSANGLVGCGDVTGTGLVLGVFNDPKDPHNRTLELTPTADKYNKIVEGKLMELLLLSGPAPHRNEVRLFYGLEARFPCIALVGLGEECLGYNDEEQIDENKERIREAAALGSMALQRKCKCEVVYVESFGHAESAAEGAAMGVYVYQEHKTFDKKLPIPKLFLFDDCDATGWQIGLHKAAAQNLARQLCDAPPNLLTPRTFAEHTVKLLNTSGINIEMKIKSWLRMVGMDSLIAIARGSCEDPVLVEATYYGCDPNICPVVLIGKGVTFDSGGLCLKKPHGMKYMRNDMAGAACIIATLRAASALQLPLNIRALIPMCENMLGPKAMKPGDIVKTLSGKTVRVEDTDTEGRLAMVDILTYAATYKPKFILDVGTLSRGVKEGIGTAATGVYTNNDALWEQLRVASIHTGDRVWRFPLWRHFTKRVRHSATTDVKDIKSDLGSACLTAAFLHEFICGGDWIHLDIYGVTMTTGTSAAYLVKGMTGRPTRTLVEFLAQFACQPPESKKKKGKPKKKGKKQKRPQCKVLKDQKCKSIKK